MPARCSSLLILAVAVLGFATGCSSETLVIPKTSPVSGSVTYQGKPVPGVRVKFHPEFDIGNVEFVPYGETGADGKFRLSTGAPGNGAPPGDYRVTLEMPRIDADPKDGLETEVDQLKGAYNNREKSQWVVTIEKGENVLDSFQLK